MSAHSPRLWFGKHEGKTLAQTPKSYLTWLLSRDDLDAWFRKEVLTELTGRGERFVAAAAVLADLQNDLEARVSEDEELNCIVAGQVCDHVLDAMEAVRARHGIVAETELTIPARPEQRSY